MRLKERDENKKVSKRAKARRVESNKWRELKEKCKKRQKERKMEEEKEMGRERM